MFHCAARLAMMMKIAFCVCLVLGIANADDPASAPSSDTATTSDPGSAPSSGPASDPESTPESDSFPQLFKAVTPGQIPFSTDATVLKQQRKKYEEHVEKQRKTIEKQFEDVKENVREKHKQRLKSALLHQSGTKDLLQLQVDDEFKSAQFALRERFDEMKVLVSEEGERLKDAQFKVLREHLTTQVHETDMAYNQQFTKADTAFQTDLGEFARAELMLERRPVARNVEVLRDSRRWFSREDVPPPTMQPVHDLGDDSMDSVPLSMQDVLQNLRQSMAEL